ncbi:MAG: LacI family DNA-binding transcriptional regulator [Propionibacterium sp.]|nr:LacI family DNA-binding transcriptional regulator [Propionibacterium sp.]
MAGKRPTRVTLKDVARAASVSIGTASDALSGRGRLSNQTRIRVAQAAADLGYVASALGKGLRTGRTNAIGIHHQDAIGALSMPYVPEFLAGAIEVAQRHDYDLTVLSSNWAAPRRTVPWVDGVIIMDPIGDDLRARELMTYGLPVVAGEHLPENMPDCQVVAADHREAVNRILRLVTDQGGHRPLLICPDRNSGWGDELRRVFSDWCSREQLPEHLLEVRFAEYDPEQLRPRIEAELKAHPEIDFILAASLSSALGALRAIEGVGRITGTDIGLACCADDPSLTEVSPQVTAVALPARALGAACAERLFQMLDDPEAAEAGSVRTLPAQVNFRESTGGEVSSKDLSSGGGIRREQTANRSGM